MTAASLALPAFRRRNVLPGFGLMLGYTVFYLSAIVLIPLAVLLIKAAGVGPKQFADLIMTPRTLGAFRVTFGISALAAATDTVLGLFVAWVLVRYKFGLSRVLDALVDLPIALPTAVAGITLTELYAPNGWIGAPLAAAGIKVAFTPLGIFVALSFVGLPFVVRTVEPVLATLERDVEEAAATLGANPWQIFRHVILPPLAPALMTGFTLAFGRGIGEYGSVIFIAGNMPRISEIVPLLIVIQLEQYNYTGAAVLGALMLLASFAVMLFINSLQLWSQKRLGI